MKLAHIADSVVVNVSMPPEGENVWTPPPDQDVVFIGDASPIGIGWTFTDGAFVAPPEPEPEPEEE